MIEKRTNTITANNIIKIVEDSKAQTLRVCEIYIKRENEPLELKQQHIEQSLDLHNKMIDGVIRLLSTMFITCSGCLEFDFDKLEEYQKIMYSLRLTSLDIDGYYGE